MKTSALFLLLLLVLVAIFDQAKSQQITRLQLVNTLTNTFISPPLTNGAVISLASYPAGTWTIVANASSSTKSVGFNLDGNSAYRTENVVPWSMTGDYGTLPRYFPWNQSTAGVHSLVVTPYNQTNRQGTPGASRTVTFTIMSKNCTVPRVRAFECLRL
jgi:hypothetical protein